MNYKAFAISAALSIASLATVQPRAAGAGAEINAVGTLTTTILNTTDIAQTPFVQSRYALNIYSGPLQGTTLALQTVVRDDAVEQQKAFQTNIGQFWGTLEGLKGSFSFIVHNVVDRSHLPATPFEAKFVVVEGTGSGQLEGICGGGLIKTGDLDDPGTHYNYTFRFGKDCRAND